VSNAELKLLRYGRPNADADTRSAGHIDPAFRSSSTLPD